MTGRFPRLAFDGPASVQRAHFGDTWFVATRSGVKPPIVLPPGTTGGPTTVPIPPGTIPDNTYLGMAILNADNPGGIGSAPTVTIQGPPDHAAVTPAGFGSLQQSVTTWTWNARTTDTGILVTPNSAGDSYGMVILFIPGIGAHMNGDSTTVRSAQSVSTQTPSVSATASPFVAGDVVLIFAWEVCDHSPGIIGSQGIPGVSPGEQWAGFVNLESGAMGYQLANGNGTATNGGVEPFPIVSDTVYLEILCYVGH